MPATTPNFRKNNETFGLEVLKGILKVSKHTQTVCLVFILSVVIYDVIQEVRVLNMESTEDFSLELYMFI